jgi:hypothetical protein
MTGCIGGRTVVDGGTSLHFRINRAFLEFLSLDLFHGLTRLNLPIGGETGDDIFAGAHLNH